MKINLLMAWYNKAKIKRLSVICKTTSPAL